MLASTLVLFTLAQVAPAGKEPAARLELFSQEDWYKGQKGEEQNFVGVLKKADGGGIGIGRFNPYRLEMDKGIREVYVGGKPALLAPYVGKRVKLLGKAVEIEVIGRIHNEIWPARLALAGPGDAKGKAGDASAILARGVWPFGSTNPDNREKSGQYVIRSAEELTQRQPWSNYDAIPAVVEKMADGQLAKILKVKDIDWKKQMLLVVSGGTQSSGGYRIGVQSIRKDGDKLVIDWFLHPPMGAATDAFTHPAEVVLTPRFDGKVEFRQLAPSR